jgi:hypothetical protein
MVWPLRVTTLAMVNKAIVVARCGGSHQPRYVALCCPEKVYMLSPCRCWMIPRSVAVVKGWRVH